MKCSKVQKKLSAYQDNQLKPLEQEEVRNHLLSCRACREQFAELESGKPWEN
ncbi:MAG: anti-sigma factor family protein [Thermodesulfobacteriota bacterium]